MLDKYESFYKLTSGPQCTLYSAFNRLTAQNALLKRIKPHLGTHQWNQILTHKQLTLTSKSKIFPKLNQIFRHKGSFFFAFEKPYGNSLSSQSPVEKQSCHSAIQLLADLLEGLRELIEVVPNLVVISEWVFFHRNSLKIVHYQPFMEPEGEHKHIATHESEVVGSEENEGVDIWPQEFRKSMVFHLGLIAYRLMSGKKEEGIASKEECQKYVELMRQNCERQILRVTNDSKMASFVVKMISSNKFEIPTFQQVVNFFCRQATQQRKGPARSKDYSLQIQLEKINISTERAPTEKQRKPRNCCLREEPAKSLGIKEFNKMGLNSMQQITIANKSKLILPYLSIKNSCSLPRKYNGTSINRHQPLLTDPRKQHQSCHAKSIGYLHTEPN